MKLNYGKMFLLGFGFFGVSVLWGVYNAFVPLFLANRFGVPPALIGTFMTLDNIAALLIQPTVGSWSDRLRTPIGRRMPFILVGAPLAALAFGLLPLAAILPLFVACTITMILTMAMARTPIVALMPDITPSRFRSQANGIINFMGGVGAITSFLGGAALYELNPAFPFWMASILVVAAVLLVFLFIKEPRQTAASPEAQPSLIKNLQMILRDREKSALRILLAIFFWFISYTAIEAFFTLYAVNHLKLTEADGARLLGQLALLFVLFSLPAGYFGAKFGRRVTILLGITLMGSTMLAMYLIPPTVLVIPIFHAPVLGLIPVVGLLLMFSGAAWALININSLPMVVDLTESARVGTYTGLYYLFSTLAAIVGPNINGWIIQLSGHNYSLTMAMAPVFMAMALVMMLGVRRGEAQP
ncbi:MAG: MFS transporter [Anaerolineaceae bacterium]|nr:MFS transporter [Anaerolineaceae bacterium]